MDYNLYHDQDFLKKYNGIFVEHTVVDRNTKAYSCPHTSIVYIAHGSGILHICNHKINASPGDIFFINPEVSNVFYSVSDKNRSLSVYHCCFLKGAIPLTTTQVRNDFPALEPLMNKEMPYIQVHDTPSKTIRNFFIMMLDDVSYSQPCCEFTVKSIASVMIVNIFRLYQPDSNHKYAMNNNIVLGTLINYIRYNLHKKITLKNAADITNLSQEYICRAFKKHTGMTFVEFANNMRVEMIKDELENTDRPLYVIYDDFEFTPQYLNRMFKKHTGYSMQDYKNTFNYKVNNSLFNMTEYTKIAFNENKNND